MSKNTQSVILNLNQNYANSKAHNYFQPVSQQLEINKNAEVALYGASIKRQPIFIDKDKSNNTFNFDLDPVVFPDNRQINLASTTATDVLDDIRLPKASIEEFGQGFEIKWILSAGSDFTSADSTSWGSVSAGGFAYGISGNIEEVL